MIRGIYNHILGPQELPRHPGHHQLQQVHAYAQGFEPHENPANNGLQE